MESVDVSSVEMPALGLGTWQLSGDTCRRAVEAALEAGYRHVDTAEEYGNETAVGQAIRDSAVDREEVFLTTKVWRSNLQYDDLIAAAEASRERLGVDYLDLLLVHWPHPRVPIEEPTSALDDLVGRGLTKHVGVSNFTRSQLSEAQSVANSRILTDQVLYHPYVDQRDLLEYCVEIDTVLTAYSPLARGSVPNDDTLARIGERYDKTPAQVALRWLVQQPSVAAIPGSSSPAHVEQNTAVFDFELTETEMQTIRDLSGGLSIRLRNKLPALMRSFPL